MGSPEFTLRVPAASSRTEMETALPKPSRLDRAKPCPIRLVLTAKQEVPLRIDDFRLQTAAGAATTRSGPKSANKKREVLNAYGVKTSISARRMATNRHKMIVQSARADQR